MAEQKAGGKVSEWASAWEWELAFSRGALKVVPWVAQRVAQRGLKADCSVALLVAEKAAPLARSTRWRLGSSRWERCSRGSRPR